MCICIVRKADLYTEFAKYGALQVQWIEPAPGRRVGISKKYGGYFMKQGTFAIPMPIPTAQFYV